MQKLGNWGVQICGCTRQGLIKLYLNLVFVGVLFASEN